MAYFNPYQQNFAPNYYQPTYQQPAAQPTQMQNGGFMLAPSEDFVAGYAVAPGNCVTFKIEGKPLVLEKSKGFSQLEEPKIERYRLIKEESEPVEAPEKVEVDNSMIDDIHHLEGEIKALWGEVKELKNEPKKFTPKRKDNTGGED